METKKIKQITQKDLEDNKLMLREYFFHIISKKFKLIQN
jgi:hypothetical protein